MNEEHIERRYLALPEDRLAGFLAAAAGKYAAKKAGAALGRKYGAQTVDLLSKSPTGAAVVNTLDDAGILKQLGVRTPGLKERLIAKLDEDIDLGGGVKVNTATLVGANLGVKASDALGLDDLFDVDEAPRPLGGPLMPYGQRAKMPGFEEEFRAGAFGPVEGLDVTLNLQHDRGRPLARTGGGGLELIDGPAELRAEFTLLPTRDGQDAALMVRNRVLRGLSVEFVVQPDGETWESGLRTIHRAALRGLGLVDSPAYPGSVISARAEARAAEFAGAVRTSGPERRTGGALVWL